jgi:hypothetical protein
MKGTNLKHRATHILVTSGRTGKHLGDSVTISDQNLPQRKEMETRALDDIVVFGNTVTSEPLLKQILSILRSREPAEYGVLKYSAVARGVILALVRIWAVTFQHRQWEQRQKRSVPKIGQREGQRTYFATSPAMITILTVAK